MLGQQHAVFPLLSLHTVDSLSFGSSESSVISCKIVGLPAYAILPLGLHAFLQCVNVFQVHGLLWLRCQAYDIDILYHIAFLCMAWTLSVTMVFS